MANDQKYQDQLRVESNKFDDLLVIDCINENYHNITHKTRAWITWLNNNCSNTKIIFKCDDDIQLNLDGLLSLFNLFNNQRSLILCRLYRAGQVVRNSKSKWFLSKHEYNESSLGTYCQGMSYLLSADLLPKMMENLEKVQYLWVSF